MKAPFALQMLIDEKACEQQVSLFRETFGESVNVTVARAKKVAGLFDWTFARRFLDEQGKADYDIFRAAAWADYDRICAAAWAERDRASAAAWATAYIATCRRKGAAA